MPFYRINGTMVHLNLGNRRKKAPAPCCATIELEGRRTFCRAISGFLCDWETGPGQTCSLPVCEEHATQLGPDVHLCPEHAARRAENAQRAPELF